MKEFLMRNVKTAEHLTRKYRPQILIGLGIGGMVTAGIAAVKATPKAIQIKEELGKREHTKFDYLKALFPVYLPSIVMGASSIACIVGGATIFTKRGVALATAYKLTEGAFMDYRNATESVVGEKKMNDIYTKIAEDKVKSQPVDETLIQTESKGQLFYDATFGRYFRAKNEAAVDGAFIEVQRELLNNDCASVGYLWDLLGYQGDTTIGEKLGWDNRMGDKPEAKWIPGYIDTSIGEPARSFIYTVNPVYEFDY